MGFENSFNYISIFICILLYFISAGKKKGELPIYDCFDVLLSMTFLSAIFNIPIVLLQSLDFSSNFLILMFDTLYSASLYIAFFAMTVYVLYMANIDFRFEKNWQIALYTPLICGLLAIFSNPWTKMINYFDKSGNFVHGDLYVLFYVTILYNIILWTVIAIRYRKNMDSNKIQYVKNFILFALLVGIGAAISGMSQLYIFGLSIFMILMIYAVQNPDEIFDSSNSMYKSLLYESVLNDFNRGKEFKVIFVRVPDVDLYQESFGEEQSNQILAQVVYFLKSIHSSSHVYRVDSRTFAVKLVNVDDIKLNALCKKIIARFAEEYKVGNNSHIFNVGLVTMSCPEDAANLSSFRKICAHLTRSIIKIDSQLTISKFLEEDKENEIIEAIKKALDNNTFRVFYQPIYSTEKKKIVAAEALLRLFDDKLGFISPELFIPIAEREGFILKIGKYVFTEVCKYYSTNKLDEKGIEYIEVNLSAVQCMQYKLAEEFMAIMKNYNMKPSQVNFEITESSAMISNSAVSLNIDYFIKSGVELSLDDYGTGYSNISYLYNLPFALMKIDKGILWSADKNRKANITLENIFSMAKDLKMRIVVEGVETEEQIKKLLKLNCDYFQGYYFSKPICEKDFLVYLDNFEVPVVCKAV